MENKRYYWMKFHKDFFSSLRIKRLRRLAGGDTYTIIYLKMQLLSITTDGRLWYKGVFDSFAEEIAEEINEDVDNVKVVIAYLLENELMVPEGNEYILPYAAENIGSETASTQRSRECRERQKALQCNTNATALQQSCSVEEEIEKELEIDKDDMSGLYKEIVDYLNEKTGSKYQSSSDKTRRLIKARMNEGFKVDDFKTVINKKTAEWLSDSKMAQYLRPETLFGTKFEGYLNQKEVKTQTKPSFNQMQQNNYDFDELAKILEE